MKTKRILGLALLSVFSAFIGVFLFTRIVDKPVADEQDSPQLGEGYSQFASMPSKQSQKLIDFTWAAEQTVHAVVHVKTKTLRDYDYRNPLYEFFYGESYRQQRAVEGYGSGVIVSKDGYIITNNHVIKSADEVEVTLNDLRIFEAKVIGTDPSTDIALLKIEGEDLPFVKYGDSDDLLLGEWVMAVGNPFNLTSTVTAGIVSAKGRNLGILDDQYRIESFIQTDAAVNPGNSGGALVNASAELVGINTAIISPSGTYSGYSFAIPINIVRKVVDDLLTYGQVQRAIMGVNITDVINVPELRDEEDNSGVYISDVTKGGAAEEAGIHSGDIIKGVNEVEVKNTAELQEQISKFRPGDQISLKIQRNKKLKTYNLVLRNLEGGTEAVSIDSGSGIILGARFSNLTTSELERYKLQGGVRITRVDEGEFKELGFQPRFIITEINGEKVESVSQLREVMNKDERILSAEGVQPNGTWFSYKVR